VNLARLEARCFEFLDTQTPGDAAHGHDHVRRVLKNALELAAPEGADERVVLPAACLHDCVSPPKDSPLRARGSRLAADAAAAFLQSVDYPVELLPQVRHAIAAHSYSAAIPVLTVEAAVVQDADRLDSLGAIGIARCLLVGGRLDRALLAADDPFCDRREPDDGRYTIDHFYAKLLKLPETMRTTAGRDEAHRRADRMRRYLDDLRREICR